MVEIQQIYEMQWFETTELNEEGAWHMNTYVMY
jgi:hypothetical protein